MVRQVQWLMETDGGIGEIEHVMIMLSLQTCELLSDTGAYLDAAPDARPEEAI